MYRLTKRIDEFKDLASELDWTYYPSDEYGLVKWLLDFKLFRAGGKRNIKPLILKEDMEMEFTALFDYSYAVSTGKSTHVFRQTVYCRYSKELALPHFLMVPEKWYHRVGTFFGMQDIDFLSYPEFSENYLLQGEDEEYIRHHFDNPEMIRFFDKLNFYSLEGVNYLMILYLNNYVLEKEQMIQLLHIGDRLHDYFKGKTPGIELPASPPELKL